MNTAWQRSSKGSSPEWAEFGKRLRMARASELALLHHYTRAEAIICEAGLSNMSSEELNLLARIHVRQRRFKDAKQRWELAIERDANERDMYETCLQVLEQHRLEVERRVQLAWTVVAVLIFVSILLCISMLERLLVSTP
jgi:hypothetical protein